MSRPLARGLLAFSTTHFSILPRTALSSPVTLRHSVQHAVTQRFRPSTHFRCCAIQSTAFSAEDVLRKAADRGGLVEAQIDSLLRLGDLLLEVSSQYNLTAIRTRDAVLLKHIVDALSLLRIMDVESPENVIDVGTGAGFPGIVLAIARPNWHVTLLDSARKKTRFHDLVQGELQLRNIDSVWARAEDLGQEKKHREKYHVAVARSVAEMRVLSELCLPLVSLNGCFLAQKSLDEAQSELTEAREAMKILGGRLETVSEAWKEDWIKQHVRETPESDTRRKSIILVRKESRTPSKYPRLPGTPKKAPL